MIIDVTWFKETGKYYSSGEVTIMVDTLHHPNFKQELINRQTIMKNGWQEHDYFVLVQDLVESFQDRNYTSFFTHLFMTDAFKSMYKI